MYKLIIFLAILSFGNVQAKILFEDALVAIKAQVSEDHGDYKIEKIIGNNLARSGELKENSVVKIEIYVQGADQLFLKRKTYQFNSNDDSIRVVKNSTRENNNLAKVDRDTYPRIKIDGIKRIISYNTDSEVKNFLRVEWTRESVFSKWFVEYEAETAFYEKDKSYRFKMSDDHGYFEFGPELIE